jgi:hypothetical protein
MKPPAVDPNKRTHIACVGGDTNKNNTKKPTIQYLPQREVKDEGAVHE